MSVRLLLRWVLNALALSGIAYLAPRLGMLPGFRVDGLEAAVIAAAILSILNLTVGPILRILTLPITCLTFGLFSLAINAAMMMMAASLVRGFEVGTFLNAIMASIIFAIVSAIFNTLLNAENR